MKNNDSVTKVVIMMTDFCCDWINNKEQCLIRKICRIIAGVLWRLVTLQSVYFDIIKETENKKFYGLLKLDIPNEALMFNQGWWCSEIAANGKTYLIYEKKVKNMR